MYRFPEANNLRESASRINAEETGEEAGNALVGASSIPSMQVQPALASAGSWARFSLTDQERHG
jgi:hypothetical protein